MTLVSRSSEVDGEFPLLVSTVVLHGRSLCTSYLPVFAINIGNQVDGEFSIDGINIPYHTGYFVYTHHESTSSLEITAQHVGSLIFHSEINLHSTYNALFVVEISRRGSNDPGSSLGVAIFLSSEVFQTFSRSMCVSTATGCLFFVERLPSLLLGVGRQALHPQVPWLHQRQSRVLWMERDCTLTLSLTASMSTSASSPCSSEEEGLHLTPLPRIAGRYFGGGGTGTPPHNIGLFVFSPAVDGELTYGWCQHGAPHGSPHQLFVEGLEALGHHEVVGEHFGGRCRRRRQFDGSAQPDYEKCRNLI